VDVTSWSSNACDDANGNVNGALGADVDVDVPSGWVVGGAEEVEPALLVVGVPEVVVLELQLAEVNARVTPRQGTRVFQIMGAPRSRWTPPQ
jgi:hypothetical protein